MVGRKKGTPKTGGRKKGTPNKIQHGAELRQRITLFLEDNWDAAVEAWNSVTDPKEKLRLYIELTKFGLPTLQSVSLDATVKDAGSVEDDLRRLCEGEG